MIREKIMKFNKTIAASLLALTFATGALATEKQHQIIQIEAKDNGPAEVSITQNGEIQVFSISQDALKDQDLLMSELSGVSEEVQQHISQALLGLHNIDEAQIEVTIDSDDKEHKVWVQKDVEKIHIAGDKDSFAFVTSDNESVADMQFIIKKDHGLHFNTTKDASFTAIQHLLSNTKLTTEQLDALQKILDSKR